MHANERGLGGLVKFASMVKRADTKVREDSIPKRIFQIPFMVPRALFKGYNKLLDHVFDYTKSDAMKELAKPLPKTPKAGVGGRPGAFDQGPESAVARKSWEDYDQELALAREKAKGIWRDQKKKEGWANAGISTLRSAYDATPAMALDLAIRRGSRWANKFGLTDRQYNGWFDVLGNEMGQEGLGEGAGHYVDEFERLRAEAGDRNARRNAWLLRGGNMLASTAASMLSGLPLKGGPMLAGSTALPNNWFGRALGSAAVSAVQAPKVHALSGQLGDALKHTDSYGRKGFLGGATRAASFLSDMVSDMYGDMPMYAAIGSVGSDAVGALMGKAEQHLPWLKRVSTGGVRGRLGKLYRWATNPTDKHTGRLTRTLKGVLGVDKLSEIPMQGTSMYLSELENYASGDAEERALNGFPRPDLTYLAGYRGWPMAMALGTVDEWARRRPGLPWNLYANWRGGGELSKEADKEVDRVFKSPEEVLNWKRQFGDVNMSDEDLSRQLKTLMMRETVQELQDNIAYSLGIPPEQLQDPEVISKVMQSDDPAVINWRKDIGDARFRGYMDLASRSGGDFEQMVSDPWISDQQSSQLLMRIVMAKQGEDGLWKLVSKHLTDKSAVLADEMRRNPDVAAAVEAYAARAIGSGGGGGVDPVYRDTAFAVMDTAAKKRVVDKAFAGMDADDDRYLEFAKNWINSEGQGTKDKEMLSLITNKVKSLGLAKLWKNPKDWTPIMFAMWCKSHGWDDKAQMVMRNTGLFWPIAAGVGGLAALAAFALFGGAGGDEEDGSSGGYDAQGRSWGGSDLLGGLKDKDDTPYVQHI